MEEVNYAGWLLVLLPACVLAYEVVKYAVTSCTKD